MGINQCRGMDDFGSLFSSQNYRLVEPTPFKPPPQLPVQKPKVKYGKLRPFTQFNAPAPTSTTTNSFSTQSRKRAPPPPDSVAESMTIDLTLDDDDDHENDSSINLTSSIAPQSTRYDTDDLCRSAKQVGEHFGYEYGLARVLASRNAQFYTVCPQLNANILTCVIGQIIIDGACFKLIDIFGMVTCAIIQTTGGIEVQNEDILVLVNCPVTFHVSRGELSLKVESENIIWNARRHYFPETVTVSTFDFMRAHNITIDIDSSGSERKQRNRATKGIEMVTEAETCMFDVPSDKATAASSESAMLCEQSLSTVVQTTSTVQKMLNAEEDDEEWDSLGDDEWEPLEVKSEDEFDDDI